MNASYLRALALPCVASIALVACGGATDTIPEAPAPAPVEALGESEVALTAAASRLAGKYEALREAQGEIGQLALREDGSFGVTFQRADGTGPFVIESGTWKAVRRKGTIRLTLQAPTGTKRTYEAVRTTTTLTLSGAGKSQTLAVVGDDRCWGDDDCGPGEACGIQVCLMACPPNDPICCGPRICVPKSAPPDECAGAWVDQAGLCRAPNDGVLPAKCCVAPPVAGEPCGPVTCAKETTCCNPLAGICVPPGSACTQ